MIKRLSDTMSAVLVCIDSVTSSCKEKSFYFYFFLSVTRHTAQKIQTIKFFLTLEVNRTKS